MSKWGCIKCGYPCPNQSQFETHWSKYHQEPIMNNDGTVFLNAVHQITLILKGVKTWNELKQEQRKTDKKFKRIDCSAWDSIKQLELFEKKHGIEFSYNDGVGFN